MCIRIMYDFSAGCGDVWKTLVQECGQFCEQITFIRNVGEDGELCVHCLLHAQASSQLCDTCPGLVDQETGFCSICWDGAQLAISEMIKTGELNESEHRVKKAVLESTEVGGEDEENESEGDEEEEEEEQEIEEDDETEQIDEDGEIDMDLEESEGEESEEEENEEETHPFEIQVGVTPYDLEYLALSESERLETPEQMVLC
ncbi:MAG: hypothetical protein M4579_000090 [Chaenotheca gracillima]|nr:MAG: hypothetical protein M4579_000090 [Chaenotheca gracillima]